MAEETTSLPEVVSGKVCDEASAFGALLKAIIVSGFTEMLNEWARRLGDASKVVMPDDYYEDPGRMSTLRRLFHESLDHAIDARIEKNKKL